MMLKQQCWDAILPAGGTIRFYRTSVSSTLFDNICFEGDCSRDYFFSASYPIPHHPLPSSLLYHNFTSPNAKREERIPSPPPFFCSVSRLVNREVNRRGVEEYN